MEVVNNYLPGDSRLVQQLLYELKSQGIFDQFRRECIADVDTKPAYQNLRQRVEGSVSTFLKQQTWSPDMNKNQVREQLRKNIYESGYLETGVERIVDQVVNPKINVIFLPQVEDVVYRYLGIAKPEVKSEVKPEVPPAPETKKELKLDITDLLPRDLEAISPESDHSFKNDSTHKGSDLKNKHLTNSVSSNSKPDEDESPPFEPLDNQLNVALEENSVDSHLSGISGLQSHDSNLGSDTKVCQMEISNQGSLESQNSSESQLSVETPEDTKMEIREDSDSKLINSNDSDLTDISTERQMETEISVQEDAGENTDLKNGEEVAQFKTLEYDDTFENNEYTNKLPDDKGQADNLPDNKSDSEKYDEKKNIDINVDEKITDDGKNQERKSDNKKYIEKKNDDKKSRSSDKYISKTYKDDKHRKSSSSSSSKDKSNSKHSSKNKEYTSSSKDRELAASSTKYKEHNSSSLKNKEHNSSSSKDKEYISSSKDKEYSSSSCKDKEYSSSSSKDNEFSASSKDKEYSSSSSKDKEYSPSAAREKNSTSSLKQKDQVSMSIKEKEYASSSNRDKNKSHKKSKSSSSKDKEKNEKNNDGVEDKSEKEKEKYVRVKEKSEKEREKANKEKEKSGPTKDSGKQKSEKENEKGAREKSDRDKDKSEKEKEKIDREKESFPKESLEKGKISREKEKSDKSRKEKQDRAKEKTDKSKEKSHKVKTETEKPELENEKPVKEKSDRDKTKSSSSSSSKHSNNKDKVKDKNSSSLKREFTSTSVRDKEKSHHSSTTSKDKSNHNDSSTVHKKDDKNIQNGKHSSSSSSLRKDKEKKRDSKKRLKDDHYSSKDKKINRRSTDRDSNDGQSGKQIHSSSFTSNSALFSQKTNGDSSSNIGSGSGDSGNSDQVEQTILKSALNPPESVEGGEVQTFKYSKPKFASNFQEARKIMRIRKQLAKLERQNQLSLAHIEIGTSIENGFSSEESKSISYNVENNRDKLNSVNNTDTEKENCSSTKENNANEEKIIKEKNVNVAVQKNNIKANENKTIKWVEKPSVVKENNKIYNQNLCVDIFPLNKKDIKEKIHTVMKTSDLKETSVLARDISLTEELKIPEDKRPDCKKIMKSKDLSKESWDALEARLAQEMSTVNCNSYESPKDDIDYIESRAVVGPRKNDKISERLCSSQVIAQKRINNEKNTDSDQKTIIIDEKIIVEDTAHQLRPNRVGETVSEKDVKDKTRRTGPIKIEISMGDNNGIVCRSTEESGDKKDEYIECKRTKVINNKRNSIKELSVVLDGDKRTKIDKKTNSACEGEDQCLYLEKPSPNAERHLQIIRKLIEKFEKDVQHSEEASCSNLLVVKQSRKRKLDETVYMKNNTKTHCEQLPDISSTESFTLPLSPAESDRSNDKKRKIAKKRNVFDRNEDKKVKIVNSDEKIDSICEGLDKCLYLEKPSADSERFIQIICKVIEKLENDVQRNIEASRNDFLLNRGRKRKLDENVMKNNNKTLYEETLEYKGKEAPTSHSVISKVNKDRMCNASDVSSTESFSLPLSPAESDKSNDKKEKNTKERKSIGRTSTSRNQKYSNEDLYKPRLSLSTRRSRGAKNKS